MLSKIMEYSIEMINFAINFKSICEIMPRKPDLGQEDLLQIVNNTIHQMKADNSLREIHDKYRLIYQAENN